MRKKAPGATKTGPRRRTLNRSEWDFANVPKSIVAIVCMREYAKECLHEDEVLRLSIWTNALKKSFHLTAHEHGMTADQLLAAIWSGLKQRADIADPKAVLGSPLEELRKDSQWPSATTPVDVVAFAIDWAASNSDIKRAFSRWVEKKRTSFIRSPSWPDALFSTMDDSTRANANIIPYDYLDMLKTIKSAVGVTREAARVGSVPMGGIIKSYRLLTGTKRGRGDSKEAQLTDLAIYRLHRAGHNPEEMAALLGKERQKFCNPPLIARAVKRTRMRISRTFLAALMCEFVLARHADMKAKDPPTSASPS